MVNKATLVKISKTVSTKLELAKVLIKIHLVLKELKFSDTDITVLAYFMVYGINNNTKDLIIKSAVCKNTDVVKGVMTRLKKAGVIYKDELNSKNYVSSDLSIPLTTNTGVYIKINI